MPKQSSFLSLPYAQVVARLDPENSNRIPVDKLLHSFEDDFEHDRLATTTNPPYRAVRKCMTPLGTSTKRAGQVRVMPGNKQTANRSDKEGTLHNNSHSYERWIAMWGSELSICIHAS